MTGIRVGSGSNNMINVSTAELSEYAMKAFIGHNVCAECQPGATPTRSVQGTTATGVTA